MAEWFLKDASAESCADGTTGWDLSTTQGSSDVHTWEENSETFIETDAYHITVGAAGPTGQFNCSIRFTTFDTDAQVRVRLQRKNSSCTVQESSGYSPTWTTTGTKIFALSFAPTWAAGDVLVLSAEINRAGGHGTQGATLLVNDIDTFFNESVVDADSGAFVITGTAAQTIRGRILVADSGAFVVTGTTANVGGMILRHPGMTGGMQDMVGGLKG